MQDAFYREGLAERGIQAIVPDECVQAEIHRIIFEELCVGNFTENSRRFYVQTIERLAAQGAQGIILGCTEIGLLVRPEDTYILGGLLFLAVILLAKRHGVALRFSSKPCLYCWIIRRL